ncbi:putative NYN domain, limkain-b1-type, meiosis regulator and mRNA stability factor 1 [Helianthus annuus]|nr:putative NYN domain, limkain-b1-type, meiosis regulator and mRNA stability factor 1 [Helianthus annuus]
MKHLSSITVFLSSSSRSLFRRTPPSPFFFNPEHETTTLVGISHFSTSSSPDSYHSHSRRNSEDVRNVRVSVWWDFENCQVPCNVNVYKVTHFITSAVRSVGIKGPIQITAFGDVVQLSRSNQEALSSTGINLTHIPNGGKNSADRSLLVDLMYWVSQNPPPAHLFLISGDRDFASTLHRLRMNNYNVLLASTDNAPAVLCSAASIMWQWTSLVKGENLTGRYFNQPPDGSYASWYGHYRVPLEDPFAVCNHVYNQTSSVQSDETSNSNSNSDNIRPIPKPVMNAIRNTLNSYPKGISITELRSELGKSNITIHKDWYGHKKFSAFLMAMPNLLRLQSQKDGQHIVHGISPKSNGPDTVSGPGTIKDSKDSVPVVTLKEDVANREIFSASSKLDNENNSTESQALPIKEEQPPQQVLEQPPVVEKLEKVEVNVGQVCPAKINRAEPEVGYLKSLWRKWFRGNDDNDCFTTQNSTGAVNVDGNCSVSKDQSSEEGKVSRSCLLTSEVVQDAKIGGKSTEVADKVSKPRGIFSQIAGWCKFWESDKNADDLKAESRKTDEEVSRYSEMKEIFTESFWNDVLAFLESSKGSASILQSKTRQEMVHNFKQFGPSQLQSLTEKHILHLVDALISEKKWVVENPTRTFPFRIVGPSRSSSSSKPLNSKGSTNNNDSQVQKQETGPKISPKNRSQILNDCQKLVNEVVKEHPKDDFETVSDNDLSDSDSESSPTEVQNQKKGRKEESSLLQILDSWYSNKEDTTSRITSDGSEKLPSYDDADKQKPSKRYSFVADKPVDGNENLINGILGSLKKPENSSAESKFQG